MIPLEQWSSGSQSTTGISGGAWRRLRVGHSLHTATCPTLPAAPDKDNIPLSSAPKPNISQAPRKTRVLGKLLKKQYCHKSQVSSAPFLQLFPSHPELLKVNARCCSLIGAQGSRSHPDPSKLAGAFYY